eukprot:1586820-Alexandrium_andersonii.AAC.1
MFQTFRQQQAPQNQTRYVSLVLSVLLTRIAFVRLTPYWATFTCVAEHAKSANVAYEVLNLRPRLLTNRKTCQPQVY